ncbi:hypothetical protein [Spirosoma migulaei]
MATRAGVTITDAKFTSMLELIPADADADDTLIANPLSANLITEAEAKANPKIKGVFTAEALNGIDALLDPALADFLEPAEIEALKGDKMTTKKITKLFEKAKALKLAGGSSTDTAAALKTLNDEIAKLKTDKDTEIATITSNHERERYFDRLAMKVTARTDVTDFAKAKEGKRVIADFHDTLNAVGGVLDLKTNKVMRKDDNTLPLFIDNKEVDADAILAKTLADNEYIKKSDPAPVAPIQTKGPTGEEVQISEAQRRNIERAKG